MHDRSATASHTRADAAGHHAPAADFWSSVEVLGRHKAVVGLGLLVTILLAGAALTLVPPTQRATATVLLLAPNDAPTDAPVAPTTPGTSADHSRTNPFLAFGGALNITATILARELMSESGARLVQSRGGTATFEVEPPRDDAPILTITATSSDPADAMRTASIVQDEVAAALERQQRATGATQSTWITLTDMERPDHVVVEQTSRLRALAAIGVLGIAATLAAAFFAESLAQRRRRRRGAADQPNGDIGSEPGPDPVDAHGRTAPVATTDGFDLDDYVELLADDLDDRVDLLADDTDDRVELLADDLDGLWAADAPVASSAGDPASGR